VAINVQDARIPDNAGVQPVDEPVIADGPAAYFSTLPIKAMLAALQAQGLPAEISQTAGTYVCNHIAYAMLHLASKRRGVRAGFIHIPYLPEQAAHLRGAASMAKADVVLALEIALRTAIATTVDRKLAAGAID
jgi:pyroglutamyl-peptidase